MAINQLTVTVGGVAKTPHILCVDSIEPRRNTFALDFPTRDSTINYRDEVLISRDGTIILKGLVLAIKPTLTEQGHGFRVSGMNMLGKETLYITDYELLEETEAASLIKVLNQPNRHLSNRENGVAWSASDSVGSGVADQAIDRLPETCFTNGGAQASGQWWKVDLGANYPSICRIRAIHEVDYFPRNFKVVIVGPDFIWTTDTEFDAGTFDDTERDGVGEAALIRLEATAGEGLIDSYSDWNVGMGPGSPANGKGLGQCITVPAFNVAKVRMKMSKTGTPDFDVRAVIHPASGTIGTDAEPDTNLIAKSQNLINDDALPGGGAPPTWQEFTFNNEAVGAGKIYVGWRYENYVSEACSHACKSPSDHGGNAAYGYSPVPTGCATSGQSFPTYDMTFELWSQTTYESDGTWTSEKKDSGWDIPGYGNILWTEDLPANTDAKFQFKAADSLAELDTTDFEGPTGTGDYFSTPGGEAIPSKWDGKRYFQIKAFLSTTVSSTTPTVEDVTVEIDDEDVYTKSNNLCKNIDIVFAPRTVKEIKIQLTGSHANEWRINEAYVFSANWQTDYFSDYLMPMPGDVFEWDGHKAALVFTERRAEIYSDFTDSNVQRLDSRDWVSKKIQELEAEPTPPIIAVETDYQRLKMEVEKGTSAITTVPGCQITSEYLKRYGAFYVKAKCQQHSGWMVMPGGGGTEPLFGFYSWDDMQRLISARDGDGTDWSDLMQFVGLTFYDTDHWKLMVMDVDVVGSTQIVTSTGYHEVAVRWTAAKVFCVVDGVVKTPLSDAAKIPDIPLMPQASLMTRLPDGEGTTTIYYDKICFSSIPEIRVGKLAVGTVVKVYAQDGTLIGNETVPSGKDYVDISPSDNYAFPAGNCYFKIENILEAKTMGPILELNTITEQNQCLDIETKGENRLHHMIEVDKLVGADLWADLDGKLNFGARGSDKSATITFVKGERLMKVIPEEDFKPQANDILVVATSVQRDKTFQAWARDADSIEEYGRIQRKFSVDNVNSLASTQVLADKLLVMLKEPLMKFMVKVVDTYASNSYVAADQVLVQDPDLDLNGAYYVSEITRKYSRRLETSMSIANEKAWFQPLFLLAI